MISINFTQKELQFIFDLLTTQNLPWVQTHPIIQSINAQLTQVVTKEITKDEPKPEKSK